MSEQEPPKWLIALAMTQASASLYASLGASCGGFLSMIAPFFGGNSWTWFFAGLSIPPGLFYFVYTTDWMFERRLRKLKG